MLQDDLDATGTAVPVQILGVNAVGHESGNDLVVADRDLPWLQDTAEVGVWTSWAPAYRDVIILDGENRVVGVFNLTTHNLANADDYAALKAMFIAAAEAEAVP